MALAGIIMSVFLFVALLAFFVLWVMAIYGAFTRTDLKENRWLWVVLLLFFSPIGMVAYFFVENKKRLGIMSLVVFLIFILGIPAFAIMSFAARSLADAQVSPLPGQENNFDLNSVNVGLPQNK